MTNTLLTIAAVIIFIVGPFWLIYRMDKRVAKKGSLFTGQATKEMKVFAVVLGIIFAGVFVTELLYSQTIHVAFPILGFALIGYGLGAGQLLGKLQGSNENSHSPAKHSLEETAIESLDENEASFFSRNRLASFGKLLVIILALSAIFIYAALWVAKNPNNPFSWIFIIGIVLFFVFARIFHWINFLRNLFK
jgi:hypothetical protein